MQNRHSRTIKISKSKLIETIRKNRDEHIKDYNEAVEAYKKEATKQLEECKKQLDEGSLKIKLQLVTPVNRSEEYDKVIEMFEWEIADEVELTQGEFNDYVHDENNDSIQAKFLNSTYR
jgi:hypothetical protein